MHHFWSLVDRNAKVSINKSKTNTKNITKNVERGCYQKRGRVLLLKVNYQFSLNSNRVELLIGYFKIFQFTVCQYEMGYS